MHRVVTSLLAGALVIAGFVAIAAVSDRDGDQPVVAARPTLDETASNRAALQRERRERAATSSSISLAPPDTEPTPAEPAEPDGSTCPSTPHGAVIDRANQRAWLCVDGGVEVSFPVTSAISQPDPGTYDVYAKQMQTTSSFGDQLSYLDRFVAFTTGKYTGARIAFHAIPRYGDGTLAQSVDSVGSADHFGDSAGCIRVRPDDAVMIWDFLSIGDEVRVIS